MSKGHSPSNKRKGTCRLACLVAARNVHLSVLPNAAIRPARSTVYIPLGRVPELADQTRRVPPAQKANPPLETHRANVQVHKSIEHLNLQTLVGLGGVDALLMLMQLF